MDVQRTKQVSWGYMKDSPILGPKSPNIHNSGRIFSDHLCGGLPVRVGY